MYKFTSGVIKKELDFFFLYEIISWLYMLSFDVCFIPN